MNNDKTNQTFEYDGCTVAATYDSESIHTNMTYDEGMDEPIIFKMPEDHPEPRP